METSIDQSFTNPNQTIRGEDTGKKSRFKWFAFGCLSSIIILFVLTSALLSGVILASRRKPIKISANTVLHLRLTGNIQEHIELDQDFFSIQKTESANSIIDKINAASYDPRISAILLEPRFVASGYPILNEIVNALQLFQQSGKKVYAYLEIASNRDYYLAAIADEIFLHPSASSGIYLTGVGISTLYLKDLLNKLGIEATVLHSGQYKGAGEEYVRQSMSPQMVETYNNLLDDLYTTTIQRLSEMRGINEYQVREVLEKREDFVVNQNYALTSKLVDSLLSLDNLKSYLKEQNFNILRFSKYQAHTSPVIGTDVIAVINLSGMITMPSSGFDYFNYISASKVRDIVEEVEKNHSIKGVVLRINSPGGSALESELIHSYIDRLNNKIPVVVSMSSTAASGGYYISAPAEYIFADPYTITGSIGVAAIIPNFSQTAKKVGANPQSLNRGRFSNFLNIWEPVTIEDIAALQKSLDRTYAEFTLRVHEGRGIPLAEMPQVAQGRIWTSNRAKQIGLIDEVGFLNNAIDKAAELAGLAEYSLTSLPKTKTLFELLMERKIDFSIVTGIISREIFTANQIELFKKIWQSQQIEPVQYVTPIFVVE